MRRISCLFAAFLSLTATHAFAADAPTTIIADPNGTGSSNVVSLAASEPTDTGNRLLVWVDINSHAVFAQVIDAVTNAPVGNVVTLVNPAAEVTGQSIDGQFVGYTVDAILPPGQPVVANRAGNDEWMVVWPSRVIHSVFVGPTPTPVANTLNLLGRRVVFDGEDGELSTGSLRHVNLRYYTSGGNPRFYVVKDDIDSQTYALRYVESIDLYLLLWSGEGESNFVISSCLIHFLGGSTCPDETVATFGPGPSQTTFGGPLDFVVDGEGSQTASLVYGRQVDSSQHNEGIRFPVSLDADMDPGDRRTVSVDSAFRFPTVFRDAIRNDIFVLGHQNPSNVFSTLSIGADAFPEPATPSRILPDVPASATIEQIRSRYFSEADVYMLRWEEIAANGGLYWAAHDREASDDYLESVEGFRIANTTYGSRSRRFQRSILVQNSPMHFSVIGRSADTREIVGTRFTPYRTDHGITASSVEPSYLYGETATFHIVLDNLVPEGGLAKLAVAHDVVLSLDFSDPAIVPVIDDGICSSSELDGDTWVCQLADSMSAGDVLAFDVTVDTGLLGDVPVEDVTLTLNAQTITISNDLVADNTAVAEVTVLPSSDLTLSLSDDDNAISVVGGETVEAAYVIRNIGANTATGVVLNVTLPESVTLANATGCTADETSGEIRCGGIPDIAPDGNTSVALGLATAVVTEETVVQIAATVETATGDANTDNNVHQSTLTLKPVAQDPADPADPSDPQDPADPEDPPASGGGGGGAFGLGLFLMLGASRRYLRKQ